MKLQASIGPPQHQQQNYNKPGKRQKQNKNQTESKPRERRENHTTENGLALIGSC
jgi:hypothetical protein